MPEKKVLVISDTHGRTENLDKILPKLKPLDQLIHLGDVGRDEDYIEVVAECACCQHKPPKIRLHKKVFLSRV